MLVGIISVSNLVLEPRFVVQRQDNNNMTK